MAAEVFLLAQRLQTLRVARGGADPDHASNALAPRFSKNFLCNRYITANPAQRITRQNRRTRHLAGGVHNDIDTLHAIGQRPGTGQIDMAHLDIGTAPRWRATPRDGAHLNSRHIDQGSEKVRANQSGGTQEQIAARRNGHSIHTDAMVDREWLFNRPAAPIAKFPYLFTRKRMLPLEGLKSFKENHAQTPR